MACRHDLEALTGVVSPPAPDTRPGDSGKCDSGRSDAVNHPGHFGGVNSPYETIKVIEAWRLDFCLGNTVKYISRAGKKDQATEIQDLKKAEFYLRRRIQQLEAEEW
jgi:hypothetical protein